MLPNKWKLKIAYRRALLGFLSICIPGRTKVSWVGGSVKIMVNVCLKQLADLKKLKLSSGYDEVIEVAVDPGAMHSMDYERLSELILTLPQGYRTVFNLSVIEGYSYTEIATMLEIKEVTCRSQLMKAKNFLANKIKTMYPEMSI
jgi:DNA-directed RNA polymerase specialized sigma24 family protein